MPLRPTLADEIKEEAYRLGFNAVGIVPLPTPLPRISSPSPKATSPEEDSSLPLRILHRLKKWLDLGFHGTMEWMGKNPEQRSDPRKVLSGCQSLIMVGMNYFTTQTADESNKAGRVARYAWGNDYHNLLKERLTQLEKFLHSRVPEAQSRSYVDTGPIMEKAWAQAAGIGWIGKHTNVVSTDFGSWLLLGEILTTVPLDFDEPATDLCGTCSLCIQACPTGAIVEPYLLDAERCISYLTIEFRGGTEDMPAELRKKIGNRIFGCDDCLDICPYNVNAQPTAEPGFQASTWTLHPDLTSLINLTKEDFQALTKGSPLRRPKYEGFMRNVNISLKNLNSDFPNGVQ